MSTAPERNLKDRLTDTAETGLDAGLLVPLLRLLAQGDPVSVADLADATDRSEDDVRRALAAVPETEYDEHERIVGQGLTLRPTRHRFTVDGEQLYTWCALDTLIFPIFLGTTATIESTSPTSGAPVRLTAGPDAVASVDPATAVVSLVNPEDLSAIRSSFCNQVDFYATAEEARPWLESHPSGEVMSIRDAHTWATGLAGAFLAARDAGDSASAAPRATACQCGDG
jgi:alkylmercury lyase